MNKNIIFNPRMLTDGGLETTLIYKYGLDLPHFAAFPLLENSETSNFLNHYYIKYLELAKKNRTGFILETATWRASPDWGKRLGYSLEALQAVNRLAVEKLQALKQLYSSEIDPIFISGCIGPRSDGYSVHDTMTVEVATQYHDFQIAALQKAGADVISALTINYIDEALGIVQAARKNGIRVVISFTLDRDGNLPSGERLQTAIERIDQETENYPLYYMINCSHPSHFINKLQDNGPWIFRLMGIRANASCKSHEELDNATKLDIGDRKQLASWYKLLQNALPNLKVYGGCCGTDELHIDAICKKIFKT